MHEKSTKSKNSIQEITHSHQWPWSQVGDLWLCDHLQYSSVKWEIFFLDRSICMLDCLTSCTSDKGIYSTKCKALDIHAKRVSSWLCIVAIAIMISFSDDKTSELSLSSLQYLHTIIDTTNLASRLPWFHGAVLQSCTVLHLIYNHHND